MSACDRSSHHGRVSLRLAVGAVLLAGCATTSGYSEPVQEQPRFASYVDVTWQHPSLRASTAAGGHDRYVLAFVLAKESSCTPVWGTSTPVEDPRLRADIRALREAGGDVAVASGGATGTYLENSCRSSAALAEAYRSALTATGATQLDVDIERPVPTTRVADALAILQRDETVDVTVTLPVADAKRGLPPGAMALLRALAQRQVDVTVNAMLMNFPFHGSWRDAMLRAAESVSGQIATLWQTDRQNAYRKLGLTVMAGRNDTGMTTTLRDARAVSRYAYEHRIASLGLWSLARDNGDCPGRTRVADDCSGIAQRPYEFAKVLAGSAPEQRFTTHTGTNR